jgi:hypothetical protein
VNIFAPILYKFFSWRLSKQDTQSSKKKVCQATPQPTVYAWVPRQNGMHGH